MSDSRIKGEKPCNLGAYVKCPIPARVFSDCVAWGCKGYTTTPATSNETHLLNLVWKEEFGTKVSFFINTSNGLDWKRKRNDWKRKFSNGLDLGLQFNWLESRSFVPLFKQRYAIFGETQLTFASVCWCGQNANTGTWIYLLQLTWNTWTCRKMIFLISRCLYLKWSLKHPKYSLRVWCPRLMTKPIECWLPKNIFTTLRESPMLCMKYEAMYMSAKFLPLLSFPWMPCTFGRSQYNLYNWQKIISI